MPSRLFGWELARVSPRRRTPILNVPGTSRARSAIISTRSIAWAAASPGPTSRPTQWHEWKSDLSRILRCSAGFFYQHFARGTRRVVFDGLEPAERFSESIQFEFFEYIYHQLLRKDDEWAAASGFASSIAPTNRRVLRHRYDQRTIGCLYLYTTPHVMLDELMTQPIAQGDIFANANTIILMGRTRHEGRYGRALAIPKHRGSACGDEIIPYRITEQGFVFGSEINDEHLHRSVRIDGPGDRGLPGDRRGDRTHAPPGGARVVVNHPDRTGGKIAQDAAADR